MGNLLAFIGENTRDVNCVVELGAGIFDNFPYYKCPVRIGIELVKSYVDNRIAGPQTCTMAINGDATKFEDLLPQDLVVDVISLIDFIEHLDKDVALDLIKRAQKRCRRIIIFSPHGTHNQDGSDSYGFTNGVVKTQVDEAGDTQQAIEAQRHKSKWYVKDLEDLGFKVNLDTGHHPQMIWGMKNLIGEDGGAVMWAVWDK